MEKPYMRIMFWILSAAVLAAGVLCAGGCAQKGPIEGEYIDMADYDVPVTEAVEVPHGMDGTLAFGATDVLSLRCSMSDAAPERRSIRSVPACPRTENISGPMTCSWAASMCTA